MPYSVKKDGSQWKVVKDEDGKVMGTHGTKKEAQAQVRAIYASENTNRNYKRA